MGVAYIYVWRTAGYITKQEKKLGKSYFSTVIPVYSFILKKYIFFHLLIVNHFND